MFVNFVAVSAKFLQLNFFQCVNFVAGCCVISVFANSTEKRNFDPLFSFTCHRLVMGYELLVMSRL